MSEMKDCKVDDVIEWEFEGETYSATVLHIWQVGVPDAREVQLCRLVRYSRDGSLGVDFYDEDEKEWIDIADESPEVLAELLRVGQKMTLLAKELATKDTEVAELKRDRDYYGKKMNHYSRALDQIANECFGVDEARQIARAALKGAEE